jgi:hypothetical protein
MAKRELTSFSKQVYLTTKEKKGWLLGYTPGAEAEAREVAMFQHYRNERDGSLDQFGGVQNIHTVRVFDHADGKYQVEYQTIKSPTEIQRAGLEEIMGALLSCKEQFMLSLLLRERAIAEERADALTAKLDELFKYVAKYPSMVPFVPMSLKLEMIALVEQAKEIDKAKLPEAAKDQASKPKMTKEQWEADKAEKLEAKRKAERDLREARRGKRDIKQARQQGVTPKKEA